MHRFVLAVAVSAALSGCVSPETPPGASYAINCPTAQLEHCFAKAREVCPQGYQVVELRRNNDLIMNLLAPDRLVVKCTGQ